MLCKFRMHTHTSETSVRDLKFLRNNFEYFDFSYMGILKINTVCYHLDINMMSCLAAMRSGSNILKLSAYIGSKLTLYLHSRPCLSMVNLVLVLNPCSIGPEIIYNVDVVWNILYTALSWERFAIFGLTTGWLTSCRKSFYTGTY